MTTRSYSWAAIVLLLTMGWGPNTVQASLIGDTVTATARAENCPLCSTNTGTFVSDSATVGVGIEFSDFSGAEIDVEANTIAVDTPSMVFFFAADFNGYSLTSLDSSAGDIVGFSLSTAIPGFDSSRISFGPDFVHVNYQGVSPGGQGVLITLQFAEAPEPAMLALFAIGLAGLGWGRRKRSPN